MQKPFQTKNIIPLSQQASVAFIEPPTAAAGRVPRGMLHDRGSAFFLPRGRDLFLSLEIRFLWSRPIEWMCSSEICFELLTGGRELNLSHPKREFRGGGILSRNRTKLRCPCPQPKYISRLTG